MTKTMCKVTSWSRTNFKFHHVVTESLLHLLVELLFVLNYSKTIEFVI